MTALPDDLAAKQVEPLPIEHIRENLSRILKDHNVGTGPGVRVLSVSVNNARARQELLAISASLRSQGPGAAKADDWLLLGDGLCAAGCFREADAVLAEAASVARTNNEPAKQAEAHFKRFRTACELGDFNGALIAYGAAIALAPESYELFDRHRYEIVAILGAGGFGTVFQCRDLLAKRGLVAVKTLYELNQARDPDEVFSEAHTLQELAHPNIIRIKHWAYVAHADRQNRRPYLVLEYFPGISLEAQLRHGTLPVADVLAIGRQVAEAMQAAHARNVLHRDLKPGNILVRKTETGWDVRVVDFGLAVPLSRARLSQEIPTAQRALLDNAFVGTLDYAPPEQRGGGTERPKEYSDVYSFGKTLLRALLGTSEAVGEDWEIVPEGEREPLKRLLEKCIVSSPARRFQGFGPVLEGLAALAPQVQRETRRQRQEKERREAEQRAAAARRREPGNVVALSLGANLDIRFAYIPPGEFLMGSPENEPERDGKDEKQHKVTLTSGFSLGIHPVTQAQWRAILGTDPSYFSRQGGGKEGVKTISDTDLDRFPVDSVSWDMAQEFCAKLSERLGRRITLPTEAQWEYACRAGTKTPFHFGSALNGKQANCDGHNPHGTRETGPYLQRPTPVGTFPANAWNLCDMHGNVWEWCADDYRPDYENLPGTDPVCEQPNAASRVLRGGSWVSTAAGCRAAARFRNAPGFVNRSVGLRVCCHLD
jgi:formylglycine-generating enzyme required for sulfatase activity